ncbi:helix-turn-helix domain-containing protein [Pseudonocardia sp. KRD291]|uniref:winged helix-turn-helix transcriptional regulator n=1 Tax=Pseudonocardia sp. KRD291 TaxID=2792007 RepID=UPI001C49EC7A|nr:helix-turn-helix domain-containing protein [Pseudonocardia sp. KRD291]MBW0101822.1 helix-turn-helix transcriptional regulator [Pseudonocardia sp. KRD291]
MPLGSDYASQACSMARALEVVGERWTLLILRDCFYGVRRFTDLHRHLGVPKAVLAARLDALTEAGVLRREEPGPARVEYVLTARGADLWPVLHALYGWGERHTTAVPRRRIFRHVGCDAELDGAGRCPVCATAPGPGEVEVHPGPGLAGEPEPTEPVGRALLAPQRLLEPLT